jgi:hypothetical protein
MPAVVHCSSTPISLLIPKVNKPQHVPDLLNQLLAPTASEVASTTNRPVAQRNFIVVCFSSLEVVVVMEV